MATSKDTIAYIVTTLEAQLGNPGFFTSRAMFGEYVLYVKGKVVALVCDDLLYVKIVHESNILEHMCEKDAPYQGAKPHYLIEEDQIERIGNLAELLVAVSDGLPTPKSKKKKVTK